MSVTIRCKYCGKTDYDISKSCWAPTVWSPAVGDWRCQILDGNFVEITDQRLDYLQAEQERLTELKEKVAQKHKELKSCTRKPNAAIAAQNPETTPPVTVAMPA